MRGEGTARLDAVQFMLQHWNTPVVFDAMYWPGKPMVFSHDCREWANIYAPDTVPPVAAEYTPEGVRAIGLFRRHLELLCGERPQVVATIMAWMAFCVQHPGRKIRWMPVIKGIQGDGKSSLGQVMSAALGSRNTLEVGPEIVCNTGGFTDWAHGQSLLMLEEIYITGRERYRVFNTLKGWISNNSGSVNGKGDKPKKVVNTCNQIAFTNHSDAMPVERTDRRLYVVFSPFGSLAQMWLKLGVKASHEHFDPIYESLAREPGQWRKWLLEWPIPEWFDANGSAPETAEKEVMAQSGQDDLESVIRAVIRDGAYGVSEQCLSSACLTTAVRSAAIAEGLDVPSSFSFHHILNRMDFVKLSDRHTIKWDGKTHRVWLRAGIAQNNDAIRQLLDATKI